MKVYYINLARDRDRRVFMEMQFERLGLDAIRIEAVAPTDLSDGDRATIRRMDAAGSKTHGYCITLSHLATARSMLATDAPHAAIFEDDAVLSSQLPAFLEAYKAAPPPSVDLLRIETSLHLLRLLPTGAKICDLAICRAWSFEGGRAGYIINRRAAAAIVDSPEVRSIPHDVSMFDPYEPLPRRLNVRQLNPALCIQAQHVATGEMPRFVNPEGPPPTVREMGLRTWLRQAARAVRRDTIVAAQKAWHQHVEGARKQRVPFLPD